jgi:hypothetical protein
LVPRDRTPARAGRGLDLPGALLAVAGLAALVYALPGAPAHGWGSARTLMLLAVAAGLLAGFAGDRAAAEAAVGAVADVAPRPRVAGVTVMLGQGLKSPQLH